MNGKKARTLRKATPVDHGLRAILLNKRAADTLDQKQTLALEKADDKAAGNLSPYRHLASRLNYKAVSR